ncbi:MAG: methyltransferase domain-containing protein [Deltaproteobacteria bacterium]|nr:methyltransferase domain-containing protein [Deltaproteobacteria bacterium]
MDHAAILDRLSREPASSYLHPAFETELATKVPDSVRQAERALWDEALAQVLGAGRPSGGIALDAGCGDGEHLAGLAERFERVMGLEPDKRLAGLARERCPGAVPVFGIGLDCGALAEPGIAGGFCFAQCLQVLGHVPCELATAMLSRLASLVGSGRAVLLSVPYTNEFADDFRVSIAGEQQRRVSREEYDAIAARPIPGKLAVRHFSMLSIEAELARAGLRQSWSAPYGWVDYQRANLMILARS